MCAFHGTSISALTVNSDKIRILVLGDSGTGKSSLVHLICKEKVEHRIPSTVGAVAEVKLHYYSENGRFYWIEFIDVCGKAKFEASRNLFYSQIDGLILVHDVTNKNSYTNLKKWCQEFAGRNGDDTCLSSSNGTGSQYATDGSSGIPNLRLRFDDLEEGGEDSSELEIGGLISLPVLIVGNKEDQLNSKDMLQRSSIADAVSAKNVLSLSALNQNTFSAESINHFKFTSFINKIIQRRFFSTRKHGPFSYAQTNSNPLASPTTEQRCK